MADSSSSGHRTYIRRIRIRVLILPPHSAFPRLTTARGQLPPTPGPRAQSPDERARPPPSQGPETSPVKGSRAVPVKDFWFSGSLDEFP